MIIRKIQKEEMKKAIEIWAHVFQTPLTDASLSREEFFEKRTSSPESREDLYWNTRWAVFDDREEIMMSSMIAAPYTMQFDGNEVPMVGIGGVATLPPYRKCGCTRACLTKVLQSAYEEGKVISYLYPFSAEFYRKFGYGHAGERNRWKIRLDAIPDMPATGNYQLLDEIDGPACCETDLRRVDEAWFQGYNLMTRDEDIEYQSMRSLRPYENTDYTYVYYDAELQPTAAVSYNKIEENGSNTMFCNRFVFKNAEGCRAILSLIGRERAQYDHAEILLPDGFDLSAMIPEWKNGAVSCTREQYGMIRAVNVDQVMRCAKARGSGTLRIRITDDIIEYNNACFSICFENGSVNNVTKSEESEDIALSINAFSTLIAGRCDPQMLPYLSDVKLNCEAEHAGKLFYRKPVFTSRMF